MIKPQLRVQGRLCSPALVSSPGVRSRAISPRHHNTPGKSFVLIFERLLLGSLAIRWQVKIVHSIMSGYRCI